MLRERREEGELADFELVGSDSIHSSPTSGPLRPAYILESPECPNQECGLGPGSSQSFPGESNLQLGGNQCLPEVKVHLQPGVVTLQPPCVTCA
jgi:hypothetical protein